MWVAGAIGCFVSANRLWSFRCRSTALLKDDFRTCALEYTATMSIHAEPPPPIVTDASGTSYATGPALGKGGFAICHRAERYDGNKPTGQLVALKIVRTKMEPAKLAQKV